MKKAVVVVAMLAALSGGCGAGEGKSPEPLTADPVAVAQRWNALTDVQRDDVCTEATTAPEAETMDPVTAPPPDYRGMLDVLMDTGFSQPDAAAMLPHALNECTR